MRAIKVFQALVRPSARSMNTHAGPPKNYAPVSKEFRAKQEYFQMDNGVLVHLKGGMMDRALYISTILMISVGLCGIVAQFYKMAYPQKPK